MPKSLTKSFHLIAPALCSAVGIPSALADDTVRSFPEPWQFGLPEPQSPMAESIRSFHDGALFYITFGIGLFVLFLLIFVCWRFAHYRNPKPSQVTHNTLLEIVWTAVPALILLVIFVPSLKLIYLTDRIEEADMTIKVTGNQWFWTYEYPDEGNLHLTSIMIPEKEAIAQGKKRLLDTDNPLVIPIKTNIRLLFTSNDVIHSWSVPALGVKMDTIPGQLNESWTYVNTPGIYYGFCTELCGKDHAYMPVHVVALEQDDYLIWLNEEKTEQGITAESASPIQ